MDTNRQTNTITDATDLSTHTLATAGMSYWVMGVSTVRSFVAVVILLSLSKYHSRTNQPQSPTCVQDE